jgi:phage gp46-like protein
VSDVLLFHTSDGGDVTVENGQFVMSDGLETAAYLSLFGGPERDDGLAATAKYSWWANLGEVDEKRKYRSETQALLRSLPATSSNLRRLEDAAERDLAWFTEEIADSVEVTATIPALNRVQLNVVIVIGGKRIGMVFAEDWKARHQ